LIFAIIFVNMLGKTNALPELGKLVREMGFIQQSQGLIERYIAVDGAWEDHLERTRNFILQTLAGRKVEHLAILGSGWLLDVPLEGLAEISGHIRLYDAIHPAQVLHRIKRFPHITAIAADITGGCMQLARQAVSLYRKKGQKTMPEMLAGCCFKPDPIPDCIISLNLLSQIGEMIVSYLQESIPYTPEEANRIIWLLQKAHLELLLQSRSCLITDVREISTDLQGTRPEESRELLQITLPEIPGTQSWIWRFDPNGGYNPGINTRLEVKAMAWDKGMRIEL
jgi:hypothetical protein